MILRWESWEQSISAETDQPGNQVWDLRKRSVVYTMRGHQDTVTSLSVSPDGQSILSNSMDSTVRSWDIRAFAPSNRLINT